MIDIPIRLNVVKEPPEVNILGNSRSTAAATTHEP